MRHANVDALSRNPVGHAADDDDFREEIQDDPNIQNDPANQLKGCFLFDMVRIRIDDEDLEATDGKQILQKGSIRYYDKWQQLELVLATQELSELDDREVDPTRSGEEENCGVDMKGIDIWRDATCLALLKKGMLPDTIDLEEGKRARKRANNYCWKELYVPKPEEE
ncbi:unnamed protein product [Sphagnum tenellum]